MLSLARFLLRSAGFEYDDVEETWIARGPLQPVPAVECDETPAYIREAMREAQAVVRSKGLRFHFTVNDRRGRSL